GNFHGRTISVISMSTDPDCTENFGPFVPGFLSIDYDAPEQLEAILKEKGDKVCAFIQEPIQGEAGVYVPSEGYITKCQNLCKQYNCLYIDDEIQTGIARTGRMLAADHENCRPDMVILGKAISGGAYPVSVVLCDKKIMDVIKPGTHGSTFGGCPMACAVAVAALEVIEEEKLIERAQVMGERMRKGLRDVPSEIVKLVRGKGLLNAVVVDRMAGLDEYTAYAVCLLMAEHGVLAKPTHSDIIRLAPPLTITEAEVDEIVRVFHLAVKEAPAYA
ncbi:ornithine aminotransferase, partial [Kipferlia bialata]